MSRSSRSSGFEIPTWLPRAALVLVVVGTLGTGAFLWWQSHQRAARVSELVLQARDLRKFEGKDAEARALLDEALKLDPGNWEALWERGRLFTDLSRHNDAVRVLENAVKAAPSDRAPEVYLHLGIAYQNLLEGTGKSSWYKMARSSYEQAREQPQQAAVALYRSAMLEIAARKMKGRLQRTSLENALELLEQLEREHPEFDEIDVRKRIEQLRKMIAAVPGPEPEPEAGDGDGG